MSKTYKNFEEIKQNEKEGVDFQIDINDRKTKCVVIAIHGGRIEPNTTEIAKEIAGDIFSFYSFQGIKEKNNTIFHVSSSTFDEPKCCDLVSKSEKVISIHGKRELDDFVMLGGLDYSLIKNIEDALTKEGFKVFEPAKNVMGDSSKNICNRCISGKGVQIEISFGLRERLIKKPEELSRFCSTIREFIK